VAVRRRPARGAPGQHFLRSGRLAAELIRSTGVERGELVVDVGAGSGVLTRALAQAGARVLALELDADLARILDRRFKETSVVVLQTDARSWSWPREPFRVVSNLPFAGSTEILTDLLRDPGRPMLRADVIVQWELAVKHASLWPATLKGTYWRAWHELVITHRLSRTAFTPAPDVDAAVLRVTPRLDPLVSPADHARYWRFLAHAFGRGASASRAVRSQLSAVEVRRLATVLGFSPTARPRDLDARQWAGLFAFASGRAHEDRSGAKSGARRRAK
jgi:23S rRNA (adenine-N6)-dimethyltransferase